MAVLRIAIKGQDNWQPRAMRTAGMRGKTDAPIVPVYRLSWLKRVVLRWRK